MSDIGVARVLFRRHEPPGDAPPGYRDHLAATPGRNLPLALLGALGAGIAWWTDSHRLVQSFFYSTVGGVGLVQPALGAGVVLRRSQRSRGAGS